MLNRLLGEVYFPLKEFFIICNIAADKFLFAYVSYRRVLLGNIVP